jgi:hypothetical protein
MFFSFISDVNECEKFSPCQNNGTCINNNGSYACNCTEGWQGYDCENGNFQILKMRFNMDKSPCYKFTKLAQG